MLRKLHRWTSIPLILFLLLVLGTGVVLQFEELGKIGGPDGGAPSSIGATSPSNEAIAAQLADALAKAQKAQPDFKPNRIELTIAENQQATRFAVQPRGGPFVEVDHINGKVKAEMKPEMPLHVILIRLHTGSIGGVVGVWIMLLSSLVLMFLAVSGIWLYWQMWRNRVKMGRSSLFWK